MATKFLLSQSEDETMRGMLKPRFSQRRSRLRQARMRRFDVGIETQPGCVHDKQEGAGRVLSRGARTTPTTTATISAMTIRSNSTRSGRKSAQRSQESRPDDPAQVGENDDDGAQADDAGDGQFQGRADAAGHRRPAAAATA